MKRSVFLMAHLFSLLNPKAVDMALDYVMNNCLDNKFVIFSDSLSVLKSLSHTSSKNPKIQNLIEKHHELSKRSHTRLTHSYLLKREDQPFCSSCNEPFTVKHFLIDCIELSHIRRQFFHTNDLRYLFENVPTDNILMFLKHINLFNKV